MNAKTLRVHLCCLWAKEGPWFQPVSIYSLYIIFEKFPPVGIGIILQSVVFGPLHKSSGVNHSSWLVCYCLVQAMGFHWLLYIMRVNITTSLIITSEEICLSLWPQHCSCSWYRHKIDFMTLSFIATSFWVLHSGTLISQRMHYEGCIGGMGANKQTDIWTSMVCGTELPGPNWNSKRYVFLYCFNDCSMSQFEGTAVSTLDSLDNTLSKWLFSIKGYVCLSRYLFCV